jgi:NadR type nicotinamide-nucleotide adenylyltransferase
MEEANEKYYRMIKRIAITGPESTGKSELAKNLAHHYDTVYVPEFSREYLSAIFRPYDEKDILEIAKGQIESEERLELLAKEFLFCDTESIVNKIWSEHLYKRCNQWILDKIKEDRYQLYLLCDIDIPWEADPLRENPEKREYFFNLFKKELECRNYNYSIIRGHGNERVTNAIKIIDELL